MQNTHADTTQIDTHKGTHIDTRMHVPRNTQTHAYKQNTQTQTQSHIDTDMYCICRHTETKITYLEHTPRDTERHI